MLIGCIGLGLVLTGCDSKESGQATEISQDQEKSADWEPASVDSVHEDHDHEGHDHEGHDHGDEHGHE